jgi:hypothetical protein
MSLFLVVAYRATISYLIEQGNLNATWTLVTGRSSELGLAGVTAISQGALFSMANVACLKNADTNVRFNEVYICCSVDFDPGEENGVAADIKVSDFARVYEGILADKDVKACRVFTDLKISTSLSTRRSCPTQTCWQGQVCYVSSELL